MSLLKIKHYVVTYNNPIWIKCVESILDAPTYHTREVVVVNNHSNFEVPEHLLGLVRVMQNQTRPDFSTGHLARNWNECLIDGFRDLSNPDADLVICSQNDTEFKPNYLEPLLRMHETLDLITHGAGDNCISYTPYAVKRIGLWDERFCNIGFQEVDYMMRAAQWLGTKASINDAHHERVYNPIEEIATLDKTTGYYREDEAHMKSLNYHFVSEHFLKVKWGERAWFNGNHLYEDPTPLIDNYIMYPFFERAVETLREQRFQVPQEF